MEELVRTNDAVFLSWLTARLAGVNIDAVVLDTHTSVMEGSIRPSNAGSWSQAMTSTGPSCC